MTGFKHASRKLELENLENRQLLAGDITTQIVDGNLVVSGDELDNHVHISSGENPGEYVLRGLPDGNGTATFVDGVEGVPVLIEGVSGGVVVDLGDGNDGVTVDHARFRHLAINTGGDDDVVRIGLAPEPPPAPDGQTDSGPSDAPRNGPPGDASVVVQGRYVIATGEGNDTVVQRNARAGAQAIITGDGDDTVVFNPPEATPPGDDGADENDPAAGSANTDDAPTPASVHVRSRLMIRTGAGADNVMLRDVHAGLIQVGTGADNDQLHLNHVQARGGIAIRTGGGDDMAGLENVHSRRVWIRTGDGVDNVAIRDSVFAILAVRLGDGDDSLGLAGTQVLRLAALDGGAGTDTLMQDPTTELARARVRRFELPEPDPDEDPGDQATT